MSFSVTALEILKSERRLSIRHTKKAHGPQPHLLRRRRSSAGRSDLWWRSTVSDSCCSSFLVRPLPSAPLLSCMQPMPEETKPTRHASCCNCPPLVRPSRPSVDLGEPSETRPPIHRQLWIFLLPENCFPNIWRLRHKEYLSSCQGWLAVKRLRLIFTWKTWLQADIWKRCQD